MVALRSHVNPVVKSGFTLVELSIVLVIIGLIIGGVLVGRELINAATVRAQISQIEKYQTAVNTFRGKYGYLPGDIPDPIATQYAFAARGQYEGEGDGNGVIEGIQFDGANDENGTASFTGEAAVFWTDLSAANLIEGKFNTATSNTFPGSVTGAAIANYFPPAKIGNGNYVYVYSGGPGSGWPDNSNNMNYFGFSVVTSCYKCSGGSMGSGVPAAFPNIAVANAYAIDNKIDDGLPQSGRVTANYVDVMRPGNTTVAWAAGGDGSSGSTFGKESASPAYGPTTAATAGAANTCYDNGGVNGITQHYSMEQNNGAGINCALSFEFQ